MNSDPETWRRIDALLAKALEHPPAERQRFLEEASDDPDMRHEIEALLAASTSSEELFQVLNASDDLSVAGRLVGAYRLLEEIGRGGMGTVYLAERADGQFRQHVAVKLLRHGVHDEEAERRFRLERQILARLAHPAIARLLDGGLTAEGQPYFVMEHVIGRPITDYCDSLQLGVQQRLELFCIVCAAVQYAHQNLIVHRDLKPANILVTEDGQVKLLDFGIARVLDSEAFEQSSAMTHTGTRLMTPDYAAPEQVRGEAITTATDVYGLGLLLYELLTGRRPFSLAGMRLQEVDRIVCEQMPVRPSGLVTLPGESAAAIEERSRARRLSAKQLRRQLRGDLDNIVMLALRKEPERRHHSVEQLAEDVRRHLCHLPVHGRGDELLYRAGKFTRRHAVGLAAIAGVVLALVGGMLATGYQVRVARLERERAELVNTFLEGMLSSADPLEGDREMTVSQVLGRAAREADSTLADRPDIEAGVRTTLGRTYLQMGRYRDAEPQLRRALALQQSLHQGDDAVVAKSLRTLAQLRQKLRDDVGADSLYREALRMQQRLFGAAHSEVATTLDRLAALRLDQGDNAAASGFSEQSLAIRQRLFGEVHVDVAESLNNLGMIRYEQGDYVAAESLGRRSLALNRKLHAPHHAYAGFSLQNTARALQALGRYDDATKLFEEQLSLLRRRLGEQHQEVANTLNHLAAAMQARGDDRGAEATYRQALAMRRQLLGEDHPQVSWSLHNLASLLYDMGAYPEAERLYREEVARDYRLLGGEHPDVSISLDYLARLLRRLGRTQEADSIYRRVIDVDRRFRDHGDPMTAYHLAGWAAVRADMGHVSDADSLFRAALTTLRATARPGNLLMLTAQQEWGQFLMKEGRIAEAEPLFREALAGFGSQMRGDHKLTLESLLWLGRCVTALGRYDEAELLLQEGYRVAQARRGADGGYGNHTLDALIELYTRWNRPRQAESYRALRTMNASPLEPRLSR